MFLQGMKQDVFPCSCKEPRKIKFSVFWQEIMKQDVFRVFARDHETGRFPCFCKGYGSIFNQPVFTVDIQSCPPWDRKS